MNSLETRIRKLRLIAQINFNIIEKISTVVRNQGAGANIINQLFIFPDSSNASNRPFTNSDCKRKGYALSFYNRPALSLLLALDGFYIFASVYNVANDRRSSVNNRTRYAITRSLNTYVANSWAFDNLWVNNAAYKRANHPAPARTGRAAHDEANSATKNR